MTVLANFSWVVQYFARVNAIHPVQFPHSCEQRNKRTEKLLFLPKVHQSLYIANGLVIISAQIKARNMNDKLHNKRLNRCGDKFLCPDLLRQVAQIEEPWLQTAGQKNNIYIRASLVTLSVNNSPAMQETQVPFLVEKIPWRRKWQPTPVFLPGESHGQTSVAGYSPWGG